MKRSFKRSSTPLEEVLIRSFKRSSTPLEEVLIRSFKTRWRVRGLLDCNWKALEGFVKCWKERGSVVVAAAWRLLIRTELNYAGPPRTTQKDFTGLIIIGQ